MFTYEELFEDKSYVCDWMTDSEKLKNLDFETALLDLKCVDDGVECDFDISSIVARICEHFGVTEEHVLMGAAFAGYNSEI